LQHIEVKSVSLDLWRIEIATIYVLPAAMQSAMEVIKDLGKINKAPCRSLTNQPGNGDKYFSYWRQISSLCSFLIRTGREKSATLD
jgi:hypothetical protein